MDFLMLIISLYIVFGYSYLYAFASYAPLMRDKGLFAAWLYCASIPLFFLVVNPTISLFVARPIFLFFTGVDVYEQW